MSACSADRTLSVPAHSSPTLLSALPVPCTQQCASSSIILRRGGGAAPLLAPPWYGSGSHSYGGKGCTPCRLWLAHTALPHTVTPTDTRRATVRPSLGSMTVTSSSQMVASAAAATWLALMGHAAWRAHLRYSFIPAHMPPLATGPRPELASTLSRPSYLPRRLCERSENTYASLC